MNEVFINDVGTKLNFRFNTDISSASLIKVKYKKPDGTTGEWIAQKDANDPSLAYYIIQDGDLDITGVWVLQLYVDLGYWAGHTTSVKLLVKPLEV